MEIILTRHCESLTGSVGRGFGYHIQRRKNGFFGKRNSKGDVPHNGHWRFIVACAQLAKIGLHIRDIKVEAGELEDALAQATNGEMFTPWCPGTIVNAEKVLQLKEELGL